MAFQIDYNRGVEIRRHGASGMDVYMYYDDPGVYLTAHATRLGDDVASGAGYDVAALSMEKRKRAALAAAHQAIEAQFAGVEAKHEVIDERDGFTLVDQGTVNGIERYIVCDPDGNQITPKPMQKAAAVVFFAAMFDKASDAPKVTKAKAD